MINVTRYQGAVRHPEGGGGSPHRAEDQQRPQPAPQHQPRHQHQVRQEKYKLRRYKIRH